MFLGSLLAGGCAPVNYIPFTKMITVFNEVLDADAMDKISRVRILDAWNGFLSLLRSVSLKKSCCYSRRKHCFKYKKKTLWRIFEKRVRIP